MATSGKWLMDAILFKAILTASHVWMLKHLLYIFDLI